MPLVHTAGDSLNGFVMIWLYLSFEITLHLAPVSNLNVIFCLLNKYVVAFHSFEPQFIGIIPMNKCSKSETSLVSCLLSCHLLPEMVIHLKGFWSDHV